MADNLGYLNLFNPDNLWLTLDGSNWIANCMLIVLIAILAHILIWMFSRAFKIEEIERYAKSEMLQAGATALLIIFIVVIVQEAQQFGASLLMPAGSQLSVKCGASTVTITKYSDSFEAIKCQLSEKAKAISDLQMDITSAADSAFTELSLYVSLIGLPVWQGQWSSSTYAEVENYRIINQISTDILVGLNAIILLVDFIANTTLRLYLPAGLLLRSFHFTRGIGAFFISLGLCFYFVFPIIFVLTDPTLEVLPTIPVPTSPYNKCFPTFSGSASLVGASDLSTAAKIASVRDAASVLSQFYISMLIHPFVVLAVTLVFVRYMMYLLGGETYEIMRLLARSI